MLFQTLMIAFVFKFQTDGNTLKVILMTHTVALCEENRRWFKVLKFIRKVVMFDWYFFDAVSQFAYLYYALKVCTLFLKKKYSFECSIIVGKVWDIFFHHKSAA